MSFQVLQLGLQSLNVPGLQIHNQERGDGRMDVLVLLPGRCQVQLQGGQGGSAGKSPASISSTISEVDGMVVEMYLLAMRLRRSMSAKASLISCSSTDILEGSKDVEAGAMKRQ